MQTDIKGHSISPLAVTLLVFIIGLGALIYSILFSTWDITDLDARLNIFHPKADDEIAQ